MMLVRKILMRMTNGLTCCQPLCTGPARPSRLQLFDEPKYVMPTIPAFSLNFNLLMYRWRFDRSFNRSEFFDGARMAMLVIARKLYESDNEGLMALVTKSLGTKLIDRVSQLPEDQKALMNLKSEDVLFFFMKSVNFSQDGQSTQNCQIMLVGHSLHNSQVLKASVQPSITPNDAEIQKFAENVVLTNMRLSKQIYPEVAEDWTCDQFNLFQPEKFSIGGKIV